MKTTITGVKDVNRLLSQIAPRHAGNIMRATVHDIAKEVRDDARSGMPVDEGVMVKETKHKRERAFPGRYRSTVRVGRKSFYWRFLEYGDGPDGVAYDFFLRAINSMRSKIHAQFLTSFGRKFESAAVRARRK